MAKDSPKIEIVNRYTPEIGLAVARLLVELSPRLKNKPVPKARLKDIIKSQDKDLFIARLEGEIVGMAVLNLVVGASGRKAWLDDFVVSPGLRGRGIGSAIWHELLQWCQKRRVSLKFTSRQQLQTARKFYAGKGAEALGTTVFKVKASVAESTKLNKV